MDIRSSDVQRLERKNAELTEQKSIVVKAERETLRLMDLVKQKDTKIQSQEESLTNLRDQNKDLSEQNALLSSEDSSSDEQRSIRESNSQIYIALLKFKTKFY